MPFKEKLTLTAEKIKEFVDERFPNSNVKLERGYKRFLVGFFIFLAIYSLIVAGVLFPNFFHITTKYLFFWVYFAFTTLLLYSVWLGFCYWKLKKTQTPNPVLGKHSSYVFFFMLMGVCLIAWASIWNYGFGKVCLGIAIKYYIASNDLEGFYLLYWVGSSAITPALVEEFFKSFPFIICFFVVIKRDRDPRQKGKGLLGNEYYGLLMGIIIGIIFEIMELWLYMAITYSSGGTVIDLFLQCTIRNWTPIHIVGGALGGFATGRAERLRFENGEENSNLRFEIVQFYKRFLPFWMVAVFIHFLWNDLVIWLSYNYTITQSISETAYIGGQIVLMIIFSIVCFLIIIVLLEQANRIEEKAIRCPKTNIFTLEKDFICNPILENPIPPQNDQPPQIPPPTREKNKFCYNCGAEMQKNYRYCPNCRMDMLPINYTVTSHRRAFSNRYINRFLNFTMILSIIFIISSIISHFLIVVVIGTEVLPVIIFSIFIELIAVFTLFYSSYYLFKSRRSNFTRKPYSGKINVWGWILLYFNYVGLMLSYLIGGIGLIIDGYFYEIAEKNSGIIYAAIGIWFILFGIIMLFFCLYFFIHKGGKVFLHYQNRVLL
ncbi:MAG: zinc ribbon domain-containing protein [Promethearchaeota archaeon]